MPEINRATANDQQALAAIARMAYGSGWTEGASGGRGHVGALKGKDGQLQVFKYNTHWTSATRAVTDEQLKAAKELREQLVALGQGYGLDAEKMAKLRTLLGIPEDGTIAEDLPLVERKVVAKAVKLMDAKIFDKAFTDKFTKEEVSSRNCSETDFASVLRMQESRFRAEVSDTVIEQANVTELVDRAASVAFGALFENWKPSAEFKQKFRKLMDSVARKMNETPKFAGKLLSWEVAQNCAAVNFMRALFAAGRSDLAKEFYESRKRQNSDLPDYEVCGFERLEKVFAAAHQRTINNGGKVDAAELLLEELALNSDPGANFFEPGVFATIHDPGNLNMCEYRAKLTESRLLKTFENGEGTELDQQAAARMAQARGSQIVSKGIETVFREEVVSVVDGNFSFDIDRFAQIMNDYGRAIVDDGRKDESFNDSMNQLGRGLANLLTAEQKTALKNRYRADKDFARKFQPVTIGKGVVEHVYNGLMDGVGIPRTRMAKVYERVAKGYVKAVQARVTELETKKKPTAGDKQEIALLKVGYGTDEPTIYANVLKSFAKTKDIEGKAGYLQAAFELEFDDIERSRRELENAINGAMMREKMFQGELSEFSLVDGKFVNLGVRELNSVALFTIGKGADILGEKITEKSVREDPGKNPIEKSSNKNLATVTEPILALYEKLAKKLPANVLPAISVLMTSSGPLSFSQGMEIYRNCTQPKEIEDRNLDLAQQAQAGINTMSVGAAICGLKITKEGSDYKVTITVANSVSGMPALGNVGSGKNRIGAIAYTGGEVLTRELIDIEVNVPEDWSVSNRAEKPLKVVAIEGNQLSGEPISLRI